MKTLRYFAVMALALAAFYLVFTAGYDRGASETAATKDEVIKGYRQLELKERDAARGSRVDRDKEYTRVVTAIARTMRCSTEAEHAKGLDHECDPSEVEQDAGLVDENGKRVAVIPCSTDAECLALNGEAKGE